MQAEPWGKAQCAYYCWYLMSGYADTIPTIFPVQFQNPRETKVDIGVREYECDTLTIIL
jgi:hypothetical protein